MLLLDAEPPPREQDLQLRRELQNWRHVEPNAGDVVLGQSVRAAGQQQRVAFAAWSPLPDRLREAAQQQLAWIALAPRRIARRHLVYAVQQDDRAAGIDESVQIDPVCAFGTRVQPSPERIREF
jgi:hypothetical protein